MVMQFEYCILLLLQSKHTSVSNFKDLIDKLLASMEKIYYYEEVIYSSGTARVFQGLSSIKEYFSMVQKIKNTSLSDWGIFLKKNPTKTLGSREIIASSLDSDIIAVEFEVKIHNLRDVVI